MFMKFLYDKNIIITKVNLFTNTKWDYNKNISLQDISLNHK